MRLKLLIESLAPEGVLDVTDMDAVAVKRAAAFARWKDAEATAIAGKTTSLSMPGLSGSLDSRAAEMEVAEWQAVLQYLDDLLARGDGTAGSGAAPRPLGMVVSLHQRELVW